MLARSRVRIFPSFLPPRTRVSLASPRLGQGPAGGQLGLFGDVQVRRAVPGHARRRCAAYYLLLTTYHLLLTAYYLLLTTYCLLLTTYYLLLTTEHALLTTHS